MENKPHKIDFDLMNGKLWCPFYSDRFPPSDNPLLTIQEKALHYLKPNINFAIALQDELHTTLTVSLQSWRRSPTGLRFDVSARLDGILDELEKLVFEGGEVSHSDYSSKLDTITKGRSSIFGFPLNFSSMEISDIVNKVKATSIHQCKHPDVQYAISTKVYPYSSKALSIWVFICALWPTVK